MRRPTPAEMEHDPVMRRAWEIHAAEMTAAGDQLLADAYFTLERARKKFLHVEEAHERWAACAIAMEALGKVRR